MKKTGKGLLPVIAGIMVVVAMIVVFAIPKNTDKGSSAEDKASVSDQMTDTVVETDEKGGLVIYADRLSSEQISFIRISEDSRIELLARLGDDGAVKATLGTCQSCNGSPGAYYTQEEDKLKCNNCGLTFPINVLDSPGGGCHPIMIDEKILHYDGNDLVVDLNGLTVYEELFSKVADH